MSVDAFNKAFDNWLRGVQHENRVRQEDANLTALVNGLQKRGHVVTYDNLYRYIFVDANTPYSCTITMHVARETEPKQVLQWVDERQIC